MFYIRKITSLFCITAICALNAMEEENSKNQLQCSHPIFYQEEKEQDKAQVYLPTVAQLRQHFANDSLQHGKNILGYNPSLELFVNEYANFDNNTPVKNAVLYCYGAGQSKSKYISQLLELQMPVVLFKFPDDARHSKVSTIYNMNLGQTKDIMAVFYALNSCVESEISHIHVMGYSRGGGASINAIAALNNQDEEHSQLLEKVGIDNEKRKKIMAHIVSVILHCPLANTSASVQAGTQAYIRHNKEKIIPQWFKNNKGVLSFYVHHTWPLYYLVSESKQSKEARSGLGRTMDATILPKISNYKPGEYQPFRMIKQWPKNRFHVWLMLQKNDQVTPLKEGKQLAQNIAQLEPESFYFGIGESDLGHFDYWKEEKNGGLDSFFKALGVPHDRNKIEKGDAILAAM